MKFFQFLVSIIMLFIILFLIYVYMFDAKENNFDNTLNKPRGGSFLVYFYLNLHAKTNFLKNKWTPKFNRLFNKKNRG